MPLLPAAHAPTQTPTLASPATPERLKPSARAQSRWAWRRPAFLLSTMSTLLLAACSIAPPAAPPAPVLPTEWQAPLPEVKAQTNTTAALPHQGSTQALSAWWAQQNDPVLLSLINAAEQASPSLASARATILEARANRMASAAALLPGVQASGTFSRVQPGVVNGVNLPLSSTAQAGLDTSWEVDLFGRLGATRDANQVRLEGSQAQWHSARVSVAAEVASQYYSLRACEQLLEVARADAASRGETARLSALSTRAGFQAPATDALARASAADSQSHAIAQHAACQLDVKALVVLTGLAEPELQRQLAQAVPPAAFDEAPALTRLPADVLAQRPDVFNAAREVDAARIEAGAARALRYPRLQITGSIATGTTITSGVSQRFDTWSVGPLSITVPLFDGGASKANTEAADARYANAAVQYAASVRQAVREVEEALVKLESTRQRQAHTVTAEQGYTAAFTGTEALYRSGLASLIELEDARRTLLAARSAAVNLQLERRSAFVALYKALGGGWQAGEPTPTLTDAHLQTGPTD